MDKFSLPKELPLNDDTTDDYHNILRLEHNLCNIPPCKIPRDKHNRWASVAIVLNITKQGNINGKSNSKAARKSSEYDSPVALAISKVLGNSNVNAKILLIKRAVRDGDRWSAHMGLPGGKQELSETDFETCTRETMEEVGIDLTNKEFTYIGQLSDRPVILFNIPHRGAIMGLSCFIFVRISKEPLRVQLNHSEVEDCFLVPMNLLELCMKQPEVLYYDPVLREHSSDQHPWKRLLVGNYLYFPAVSLSNLNTNEKYYGKRSVATLSLKGFEPERDLRVWGLTFGLISDLLDLYVLPNPSMKSLGTNAPRFDSFDVNLMIKHVFHRPSTIGIRSDTSIAPSEESQKAIYTALFLRAVLLLGTTIGITYKRFIAKL